MNMVSLSDREYRLVLTGYLQEALEMVRQALSDADFTENFPHIFGEPGKEVGYEYAVLNSSGLLLRKAELHLIAALKANSANNLHSLAVQMRVVLECASQVTWQAIAGAPDSEGNPTEMYRLLESDEYDYKSSMLKITRGEEGTEEIQQFINFCRASIGWDNSNPPTKTALTDKAAILPGGRAWYGYLSKFFCHTGPNALSGPSFYGGVLGCIPEHDELAFAFFLQYLLEVVVKMLVANGSVKEVVTGDSQLVDEAMRFWDKMVTETNRVSPEHWRAERPSEGLSSE